MNFFTLHPDVYSTDDKNKLTSLPDLLDYMWNGEEIEAKEGQLNYMQNRVTFSTITVEFYKPIAEQSGVTASYGMKIWTAIKSGFNSISTLFINLLSIWPFIIFLIAIIYFIRKRFKTKKI